MKIAIATTYHPSLEELAVLTDQNKEEYAFQHDYDYHSLLIRASPMNFAWSRWQQFLELFELGYDWILCCGVDVIFTNFYIPIEVYLTPERHVVLSRDSLMVQGDVILVRNSEPARHFIHSVIALEPKHRDNWFQDQTAMEEIIKADPGVVTILPQCDFQTYEYAKYAYLGGNYAKSIDQQGNRGQWIPGDFILHCPGRPLDEKIAEMKTHLPLVIRPASKPILENRGQ